MNIFPFFLYCLKFFVQVHVHDQTHWRCNFECKKARRYHSNCFRFFDDWCVWHTNQQAPRRRLAELNWMKIPKNVCNCVYFVGIPIRIAGNKDLYMHNKFCLIDVLTNETKFNENAHPLNGLLISGSLNWTSNVRITTHLFCECINCNTFLLLYLGFRTELGKHLIHIRWAPESGIQKSFWSDLVSFRIRNLRTTFTWSASICDAWTEI